MDPMEAIKATFFQECDELLGDLEAGLLTLETGDGDLETVNAVFRAVHSVKGGAGAFGLEPLVRFAHVFETTMDMVRSGALAPDPDVIKVLLRAADHLADHVSVAKGNDTALGGEDGLVAELEALSSGAGTGDAPVPSIAAAANDEPDFGFSPMMISIDDGPDEAPAGVPDWSVSFTPKDVMYRNANDALPLMRELTRLGPVVVSCDVDQVPLLDALDPLGAYLTWNVILTAPDVARERILDVFEFVDGDCLFSVEPVQAELPDLSFVLPDLEPLIPTAPDEPEPALLAEPALAPIDAAAPPAVAAAAPAAAAAAGAADAPSADGRASEAAAPTIRVDLDRVDRLIDLVGELVINQAMLAQRVMESGVARSSNIALGLDDLEQLTREIQDSVMAIRAQPVKSVFQRMPRLAREVAAMTGKRVRLVTEGEGTEVDKTVIERLAEPLTHMLRNSIDHGLETPEERRAVGKPEEGVVKLAAMHRSGRIVIEISDDGKGINRERVREIAIKRGLIEADASLSDEEIDNLIFAPGFSTAATISDVSGRGVGMDVVKRSIQALGGRITIVSKPGHGSTFTMSLPLTLAVLDGMVVTVGEQTLVVPITAIVESLQPKPGDIQALGPEGHVLSVRGAYVPLIDVSESMGWTSPDLTGPGVTLLVESGTGGLAALRVDAIQGQRQVVIKSLELNYQQVEGIAAATILGDGRVALILDVDALISLRKRTAPPPSFQLAIAS
ncbi:chemotaxis protein CheA [Brevundimonas sp. LM2]|uniref:chemotaxis protein CheA n=1 Tax=Brevundimonas sp. LM2 TaxID=1938605 RepID=UPI000983EC04|nr:chemotaxis protein CheA [Brevundimonas sp. LM2]AQR62561.1 chemotaxis protein CheA [Brevundimonas sp. LM2]